MEELQSRLFWLHIKKAGGTSTRAILGDAYRGAARRGFPSCFTGRPRAEWNDILNNFRVPLGEYQFRRAQFARDFLYPEWDRLVRLAFVREPVARCVSMFHYLYLRGTGTVGAIRTMLDCRRNGERSRAFTTSQAFDGFLELLTQRFAEPMDSVDEPRGLHFTTHTARMWDDVTDSDGRVLLDRIYRLEHFEAGVRSCLQEIGHSPAKGVDASARLNSSADRETVYRPSAAQRAIIERLYEKDFELYERGLQG